MRLTLECSTSAFFDVLDGHTLADLPASFTSRPPSMSTSGRTVMPGFFMSIRRIEWMRGRKRRRRASVPKRRSAGAHLVPEGELFGGTVEAHEFAGRGVCFGGYERQVAT